MGILEHQRVHSGSVSSSLAGTTIGRFRVDRLLGKGGMGAVYAAFDEKLERDVALKVLLEEGETASMRKRVLREARIAAKLQHPNIATVYEVDQVEEKLVIVMELLEGQALRKALNERKFGIEESISIARDMARGLARAHAAGVVHRDIKPENVFLTSLGGDAVLAKLLDFGLARQHLVATPTGSLPPNIPKESTNTNTNSNGDMWGTPGYVSPEQALGLKDIDARTDIFSLGVVFYEMLANIRPFRGETAVATMIATTRNPERPLLEIVPDLPPRIDDIVKRCLRKKKEERFQDGNELSAALEAFARGSASSLRMPSIGSSPSLPLISQTPSQVPPLPKGDRISNPGLSSGEGEAPTTTGSAALSMSTQQESMLAMQEHQRDRMKLFIALTVGAAVALLSGILLITMALTGKKSSSTAAAGSASAVAETHEVPVTSVTAPPEPEPEPPPATSSIELEPEPAPSPSPSQQPESTSVTVHHSSPHPRPAPIPAPAGSGKKPKPADCAKSPFTIDSKGVRIPKLYCL